ncbi:LytTR family DNA-binding domain-containing protein [Mesonia sp. HuA40]|uniref:LytR/AlgR family response regulator transcription factor n=1 Tax=Mesonia sp. HuA40 TaxID=2602761 RepID=UPI0011C6FBA1|nr:LytTR family DNA-binding domain-containing protein [Mesonia sp. HuA40]TXK75245.1 response regulator transcription factor [Mesonia sp. HuA40]
MLEIVLLDDELKAVKSLEWEIENYCQGVNILKTFTNPNEALLYLKNHTPDCLFIDVEMPQMNGLEFISKFQSRQFAVVFVTAYSQYAIKAIKESAFDYLLKPIDTDDLVSTINRLKYNKEKKNPSDILEERLNNQKRVAIPVDGKLVFIEPQQIAYCKSDGNYCRIYLCDGNELFLSKKLKDIQCLLPDNHFFRVHNSYLVNLDQVCEFVKAEAYIVLKNNIKIPVSRNKKADFLGRV